MCLEQPNSRRQSANHDRTPVLSPIASRELIQLYHQTFLDCCRKQFRNNLGTDSLRLQRKTRVPSAAGRSLTPHTKMKPITAMSSFTYKDLERFGADINDAVDARDRAQLEALDEKAATYCQDQNSDHAAYVWYFRSNIQAALQDISDPRSWDWRQPHRERQILYLRRAASHQTFIRLAAVSQASILTNLGNSLSSLGRGLEAIELYDAALECVPKFAMALGNRGSAMHDLLPGVPDRDTSVLSRHTLMHD